MDLIQSLELYEQTGALVLKRESESGVLSLKDGRSSARSWKPRKIKRLWCRFWHGRLVRICSYPLCSQKGSV
jgi:hypothetical protein